MREGRHVSCERGGWKVSQVRGEEGGEECLM